MSSLIEAMTIPAGAAAAAAALATLFGACLACSTVAGFHRQRKLMPSPSALEIRAFARRLSRFVYFSLYSVFGVSEVSALLNGQPLEASAGSLGGYLAAGVCVLVLIRVQSAAWHHAVKSDRAHRKPLLISSA